MCKHRNGVYKINSCPSSHVLYIHKGNIHDIEMVVVCVCVCVCV